MKCERFSYTFHIFFVIYNDRINNLLPHIDTIQTIINL